MSARVCQWNGVGGIQRRAGSRIWHPLRGSSIGLGHARLNVTNHEAPIQCRSQKAFGGIAVRPRVTDVEVEVVVAHSERATLRVGEVFLKIDADQTRTDIEAEAMRLAPVPTPRVLWRKPPV